MKIQLLGYIKKLQLLIKKYSSITLNIIFPPYCRNCKIFGSYICKKCIKKTKTHAHICPSCHTKTPLYKYCYSCRHNFNPLQGVIIGFIYQHTIKQLILELKYKHIYHISEYLSYQLSLHCSTHRIIQKHRANKTLFISNIPAHRRRTHIQKGYNQSTLLAKHLAKHLQCPYIEIMKKTKYTISQTRLSKIKREKNNKNVFTQKNNNNPKLPKESCILLVDDIITTGSTLKELAQKIGEIYPSAIVRGVVVARNN